MINICCEKSTVKDLHYCLCLPHIQTLILSLTNDIPQSPLNATKHNAPHLAAGLRAASVHPPFHNRSPHQARWVLLEFLFQIIFQFL